jgi:hypothetical protein
MLILSAKLYGPLDAHIIRGAFFFFNMGDRAMENRYQELMFKSELAEQTARKSESNWAWQYWQGVADKLREKALALPLEEIC